MGKSKETKKLQECGSLDFQQRHQSQNYEVKRSGSLICGHIHKKLVITLKSIFFSWTTREAIPPPATHHVDLFQSLPLRVVDVLLDAGLATADQPHVPGGQHAQGYEHAEADDELEDHGLVVGRLRVGERRHSLQQRVGLVLLLVQSKLKNEEYIRYQY